MTSSLGNPVAPWAHDRPVRNRNPGDLRPHEYVPWPGQVAVDGGPGGPFSIFASPGDGWAALGLWIYQSCLIYHRNTAAAMIEVFAPASENDTAAYRFGVVARVGDGVIDPDNRATRAMLCKAIAHWEDYRQPVLDAHVEAAMILCEQRWPAFARAVLDRMSAPPVPDEADALNQAELNKLET
jgi:hypothetical protein